MTPLSALVVEDSPATRDALLRWLGAEGYPAAAVPDGRAALDYLRCHPPPRLIVLDLAMPEMDGWEFLVERHKDPKLVAIPVVIFTAASGIDAPALRALGADELLHKPADAEELLAAVGRYCGDGTPAS
jgi:chemotaxis family two-component system sensor histidine kinase/response regulator PixL